MQRTHPLRYALVVGLAGFVAAIVLLVINGTGSVVGAVGLFIGVALAATLTTYRSARRDAQPPS